MPEYKLKQLYPGLPKDWEVGMIVSNADRSINSYYSPIDAKYIGMTVMLNALENYPNFWEKIAPKTYKILTCIQNSNGYIHSYDPRLCLEANKSIVKCSIHSFQRLSDNVIFKIGDTYTFFDQKLTLKIESINISDNGDFKIAAIEASKLKYVQTFSSNNLSYLHKVIIDPLFITDDNIGIYEGDTYWCIFRDFAITETKGVVSQTTGKALFFRDEWKKFSTEKAAQEYVQWNKEMFSRADLMELGITISDTIKYRELLEKKLGKIK